LLKRLKLWLLEKVFFPMFLFWERRSIRELINKQAEEDAHYVGKSNGTRYIDPAIGRTAGRRKARTPRRRR